jgi:hypothetical protein
MTIPTISGWECCTLNCTVPYTPIMKDEDRAWFEGQKLMCDGDEAHNRCGGCQNLDENWEPMGFCDPLLVAKYGNSRTP